MKSGRGSLAKACVHCNFCRLASKYLRTEGISARRNMHMKFKTRFVPKGIQYKCLGDPFAASIYIQTNEEDKHFT